MTGQDRPLRSGGTVHNAPTAQEVVEHMRTAAHTVPGDVVKRGPTVPVTQQLLADAGPPLTELWRQAIHSALEPVDRWLHPWRYPDPNPMPTFTLFPRAARLAARLPRRREPQ